MLKESGSAREQMGLIFKALFSLWKVDLDKAGHEGPRFQAP